MDHISQIFYGPSKYYEWQPKEIEKYFGNKVKNIKYFKKKLTDKKIFYFYEKTKYVIDNLDNFLPKEDKIKIIKRNITKKEILEIIKNKKVHYRVFY